MLRFEYVCDENIFLLKHLRSVYIRLFEHLEKWLGYRKPTLGKKKLSLSSMVILYVRLFLQSMCWLQNESLCSKILIIRNRRKLKKVGIFYIRNVMYLHYIKHINTYLSIYLFIYLSILSQMWKCIILSQ